MIKRILLVTVLFAGLGSAQTTFPVGANDAGTYSPASTCAKGGTCTLTWTGHSARYGYAMTPWSFSVPSENGRRNVTLHVIEPSNTAAGKRVFTIAVQGQRTGSIDPFQLAGKTNVATAILFPSVPVWSGQISVDLVALAGNAMLVDSVDLGPMIPDPAPVVNNPTTVITNFVPMLPNCTRATATLPGIVCTVDPSGPNKWSFQYDPPTMPAALGGVVLAVNGTSSGVPVNPCPVVPASSVVLGANETSVYVARSGSCTPGAEYLTLAFDGTDRLMGTYVPVSGAASGR